VGNIAPPPFAFIGRVDELQLHFGGREGHAVQLEVAGFLHLPPDRHVGDDGLADVGLPDAHHATPSRHARPVTAG
jgi:hypothetical protein